MFMGIGLTVNLGGYGDIITLVLTLQLWDSMLNLRRRAM